YHHRPPSFSPEHDLVLSLTEGGSIYRSGMEWESDPGTVAVALARIEGDLRASPARFDRTWFLAPIEQWSRDWIERPLPPEVRARMRPVADLLSERAPSLRWPPGAVQIAAHFYESLGLHDRAIAACRRALSLEKGAP